MLEVTLALDNADLAWAKSMIENHHYLKSWPHNQSRPHTYIVRHVDGSNPLDCSDAERVGVVVVSGLHITRCKGWWGYEGLPTQWQVLNLSRIWLAPSLQSGGRLCHSEHIPGFVDRKGIWRPAAATWVIRQVLDRVGRDRISLWPPVYPDEPYHIRLVVSYSDPKHHRGEIYRNAKARPLYKDADGRPAPGPAGKVGWYWRLPEPSWTWQEIEILRPRTMRLNLDFAHN